MHTCMMPVAPNRLVNISSVLEYASVLIGVHQVKYMEVQTMDAVKILMVDDEERMRKLVKDFLTIKGYRVLEAGDGEQAIDIFFKEKDISLVILDVMMPKMDGWEVVKEIRKVSKVPIIMLTAKGDDMDKILGLEYGADDYITKPFNILEVKARIKAIIRRNNKKSGAAKRQKSSVVTEGDLKLDRESRRVFIKDKEINLTAKEFDLLELLVTNPNKVYSRESLLEYVWGNKAMVSGDVRTVDVHVRRLREKIEPSPSDPKYVHTKWGVGYFFRA